MLWHHTPVLKPQVGPCTYLPFIGSPFGSTGTWRNLDVAVKTVLVTTEPQRGGGARQGGMRAASYQRAVSEAAVSTTLVHPNVVCVCV